MIGTADLDTSPQGSRRERLLRAILVVCLIANLALFLVATTAATLFPYGLNYTEGLLIDQAERIAARQSLYKAHLDEPPYVIANYPPLYPLAIAGTGSLVDLPLLQVGRAISLLAALVSGLIVGLLGFRLSKSPLSGWLAAALFLGNTFVMLWASLARVDLLALALSLVALWLLFRRSDSWPWLLVATLFQLAAIYTRQTYALAVPLAGAVWLWHRDRRRAVVFVASLALACLSLFAVLNTATQGGFYLNVFVANTNTYRIDHVLISGAFLAALMPIALALAGVEIVQTLRTRAQSHRGPEEATGEQLFVLYGLLPYTLGAFLSALAIGKIGSDMNYLLEFIVALSLWAALAVARQPARRTIGRQSILLLIGCQFVWMLVISLWLQSSAVIVWRDLAKYDQLYEQVREAAMEGQVLAGDHLELVVLAGQRVYYQPFTYRQLHLAGLWDPSDLVREVKAQKFPLILLDGPVDESQERGWPPQVIAAIAENYHDTEQLLGYVVYRPCGRCE